jgi:hypothetical protein
MTSPELVLTISNPVVSRSALDVIHDDGTSLASESAVSASAPPPPAPSATSSSEAVCPPLPPSSTSGSSGESTSGALLLQAFSLDNVKVDGRVLNRRAVAPPQLVVNLSDS